MQTSLPPLHPGELLREDVLPAIGKPVAEIARLLGISRQMLHGILNCEAAVTPAMALKLGKLCGNGPQLWANLQLQYDLATQRTVLEQELDRIPTLAEHPEAAPGAGLT